jgi:hypothetical protein
MAASLPLQIQFTLTSARSALSVAADGPSVSISPLMTVGFLRRQAWSCLQHLLPIESDGALRDESCLRLVCAGIVLNDEMNLLGEYLKPPPTKNIVFVVYKPTQQQPWPPSISAAQRAATAARDFSAESSNQDGDGLEGEFFCRICHGDGAASDFIQPCACSGSMRHVHAACLSRWRSVSANTAARTRCEQCHQPYHISQEWWVQPLLAPSLIFACSSLGLALALIALGLLLSPCAHYFLSLLLLPPDTDYKWLISGLFGLGAISFCHLVHMRFSWMFFRGGVLHINWHSLLLTLLPILSLQDMTIRVVIALGFLHAVTHSYAWLRSFAMRYCSAHGERITSAGGQSS